METSDQFCKNFVREQAHEQPLACIDDKLNRIMSKVLLDDDEDVIMDWIGHLVLLKIALANEETSNDGV